MGQTPYQESNSDAYSSYNASCWTLDILDPPPYPLLKILFLLSLNRYKTNR